MNGSGSVSQIETTDTTSSQLGCGTSCSQRGCQGSEQSACVGNGIENGNNRLHEDAQDATGRNAVKVCVKCKSRNAQVIKCSALGVSSLTCKLCRVQLALYAHPCIEWYLY